MIKIWSQLYYHHASRILLVNGATGISAGYATDIPPHALDEVLDAVLMRLDNPVATVDDLMTVIKGPDFPTGGIIQGSRRHQESI